jgi:basic amino acid/polyamine antiporter, APA family
MPIDGLKRVLGLPAVAFIAVGMTIGGGIFVFTGIVLKITGPALPLAFAFAVVPVFLSMLPLAMLGSALPVTGGNYMYPSRMVSPRLAFTGIWVYALATFFGQIPLYSIACARYIQVIVPGLSETAFAAGLITFFCVINVIGVRPAARLQAVMVLVLLSALLFFVIKGLAEPNPERFDRIFQRGAGNLFLGMALLTFTYLGSNGIIELGQEIQEPGKVIPRAYFIAFPIVTIIYLLMAVAVVNAVSWQSLADVREPLIEIGKITMSRAGLIYFVLGGAVLALTTTLNGLFIMATKSVMAITDDRLLPKGLGRVNKRFGTAHLLFFAIWGVSMVGVFSGMALETFACYAALGGIIIFIPVLLASLALPRLYPKQYRDSAFKLTGFWRWFCPAVGIVMGLFFCLVIIVDLKEPAKVLPFFFFILSGVFFYELRRRYLLKRGIDVEKTIKNDIWTVS